MFESNSKMIDWLRHKVEGLTKKVAKLEAGGGGGGGEVDFKLPDGFGTATFKRFEYAPPPEEGYTMSGDRTRIVAPSNISLADGELAFVAFVVYGSGGVNVNNDFYPLTGVLISEGTIEFIFGKPFPASFEVNANHILAAATAIVYCIVDCQAPDEE